MSAPSVADLFSLRRIIDCVGHFGPPRMQFANCMQGVVVQQILPRRGQGRAAAAEIMLRTPATVNLIRTNQIHKVRDTLTYSDNMQNMADVVSWLKEHGVIEESVV